VLRQFVQEGDPDRPLVVGSVYNAEQTVPFALPGNKTQSGLRTHSSMGGSAPNCNEFRFEDLKGSEQVLLHAEKDLSTEVEHDASHWWATTRPPRWTTTARNT